MIRLELRLADDQSGDFAARIGKILKVDLSNYGPGVVALVLGAAMMTTGFYLYSTQKAKKVKNLIHIRDSLETQLSLTRDSLNEMTQPFEVEGTVENEGDEDEVIIYPSDPPHEPRPNGELYGIEVRRGRNGDFPRLAFMHEDKFKVRRLNEPGVVRIDTSENKIKILEPVSLAD